MITFNTPARRRPVIEKPRPTTIAGLRSRWFRYAAALDHPMMELTAEEFAPIVETFKALVRHGDRFDPTLTAIMRVLEWQMYAEDVEREDDDPTGGINSDDDADSDFDDPDDDVSHDDSIELCKPAAVALRGGAS